ncbi:HTH_Tnp_Tc3_2 domain-containing protein [Trichonephila clavipes]|nr:HTH_Tnp_Tc3_2 domain-containing protein [Trichonephila clavipes]
MGRSDVATRRQEWVDSSRFQRHGGSGRTRVTADWEDILIVRSIVTAPGASFSAIRCATLTYVSTMTIHRSLRERNLRSYQPLCPLPLTPAHCRARLRWCLVLSG